MADCIFCRIVKGELPAQIVYETESVIAFRDLHAQAPTHVLVIPRRHIATLNDLMPEDASLMGEMVLAAQAVAHQEGIADQGYRTIMNCNLAGGQTVYHIHLHVLGGRQMTWPPG
ncbi:histidine triad nucleotide-binding protein [Candidatus Macondimonas diazotrophica]|jgi:histidine triad (HIT) family protein|uniref:Histidine triad nucleotide-binding protein n=1 Tax=Candidatus Macondimonas diazotrophica TaxID=2305248 RepID=A0A4Z0FAK6_9GAMM|nr:histidine triad nucleotide-binding protein [Candidatus Macondimonas diazotrophica]MDY6956756.1 histidine triad nucleotide-binding protein [Pseudomonadota bacterium]HBG32099.1 histidine triad nucleotide-binding protein [Gammaproteobacteria bacterium]NCU01797.1 histidine triad nucleotide-binding protein [Candidatus Macondimonas diazotrophica]TFZ82940.1 histidine triad nucleotide-binding protein [Candidatus Macondimonas diazotrophica]HBG52495.1 histidine triad nucleotide-binding protein [Gamma